MNAIKNKNRSQLKSLEDDLRDILIILIIEIIYPSVPWLNEFLS